jgi:hypothetical protein
MSWGGYGNGEEIVIKKEKEESSKKKRKIQGKRLNLKEKVKGSKKLEMGKNWAERVR